MSTCHILCLSSLSYDSCKIYLLLNISGSLPLWKYFSASWWRSIDKKQCTNNSNKDSNSLVVHPIHPTRVYVPFHQSPLVTVASKLTALAENQVDEKFRSSLVVVHFASHTAVAIDLLAEKSKEVFLSLHIYYSCHTSTSLSWLISSHDGWPHAGSANPSMFSRTNYNLQVLV